MHKQTHRRVGVQLQLQLQQPSAPAPPQAILHTYIKRDVCRSERIVLLRCRRGRQADRRTLAADPDDDPCVCLSACLSVGVHWCCGTVE
ncbi:unnamed protein product [Onchocerca ochengi]|uniref:Uncharacterized protein n=1 Tax=Onchocerca ochengi TaxID=42157 RepID=A0A182DZ81_ONCOC|nr:unnamed protein product [Onchocerca ochengi]